MSLSAGQTIYLLTTLVEVFVVYLFLARGLFRKFLFFNCYLIASVATDIARWIFFSHFVAFRIEYFDLTYFAGALLSLFLYLGICQLARHLVGTRIPCNRVLLLSALALLAAAWASFATVWTSDVRSATYFASELSENICVVSVLGVAPLWVWSLRNKPDDWISAQLLNVLSIYFLVFSLLWHEGFQKTPDFHVIDTLYPMVTAWLPLGCGFVLASDEQPPKTNGSRLVAQPAYFLPVVAFP
jgi:hypothetical protein